MITKTPENDRKVEPPVMRTPPVVSPEAWESARQQMLVKEKAMTRARDALAAERRRMPWMPVDTAQRRGSGFFMKSASATRSRAPFWSRGPDTGRNDSALYGQKKRIDYRRQKDATTVENRGAEAPDLCRASARPWQRPSRRWVHDAQRR
jgi:hypothetical protein